MPLSVHLMFFLLAFVLPYMITPRGVLTRAAEAPSPPRFPPVRHYLRNTAVWLLVAALVYYVVVGKSGHSPASLGLEPLSWLERGWMPVVIPAILVTLATLLLATRTSSRPWLIDTLQARGSLHQPPLPSRAAETPAYLLLELAEAVSAEVVYRGFVIWYLSLWMPTWLAALLSVAIFVWSEWFRGSREAAMSGAYGAVNAGLLVATGGLLAPVLVSLAFRMSRLAVSAKH